MKEGSNWETLAAPNQNNHSLKNNGGDQSC